MSQARGRRFRECGGARTAPHRWPRCALTCSTAIGNGEHAKPWQRIKRIIVACASIVILRVDLDVMVDVDLDGDGDVDRDDRSDVMVDVDLDGDGDVDRDDPSVDGPIILVSTATTASSRRMPSLYRALPQACGA